MVINYDIEKINRLLEDFYYATDINMNLLKPDFTNVGLRIHRKDYIYCREIQSTKAGEKGCKCSDQVILEACRETKKMQLRLCHAGLWDAVAPILYDDVIIGYIGFGKMKMDTDYSANRSYIASLGLDVAKMEKYFDDIMPFDRDKIQGITNIASMLAKYILLEDMLKPNFDENIEKAVDFIQKNLAGDLSIKNISRNIYVSKNVLYKSFREKFDCTVSEYINVRRVEKSTELLMKTDLSIEEISQQTGFTSASYYSKIFKKLKGVPPLKYKKEHQKKRQA